LDDRVIGSLVCPAHAQRLSVFKLLKRLSLARPHDAIDFADIFALAKSTRSALRMLQLDLLGFANAIILFIRQSEMGFDMPRIVHPRFFPS
jgi:hypothetical protein